MRHPIHQTLDRDAEEISQLCSFGFVVDRPDPISSQISSENSVQGYAPIIFRDQPLSPRGYKFSGGDSGEQ